VSVTSLPAAPAPLLSVLIPAYNFAEGVGRAIGSMGQLSESRAVEVLVSDDSADPMSATAIEKLVAGCPVATYVHNRPALGAVRNWNELLSRARGEYCLLLHHDEYFESAAVFDEVLRLLASPQVADGVLLSCKISLGDRHLRQHVPTPLSRWVLTRWPGYLFRRNVLGAPSVLVLRRSMYEAFDVRLRWFVDVEFYVRVLSRHCSRLVFLRGQGIVSDSSLTTSITSTLKDELGSIRQRELMLMAQSGALSGRGSWLMGAGPVARIARPIEAIVWVTFRLAWRGLQSVSRGARTWQSAFRRQV